MRLLHTRKPRTYRLKRQGTLILLQHRVFRDRKLGMDHTAYVGMETVEMATNIFYDV